MQFVAGVDPATESLVSRGVPVRGSRRRGCRTPGEAASVARRALEEDTVWRAAGISSSTARTAPAPPDPRTTWSTPPTGAVVATADLAAAAGRRRRRRRGAAAPGEWAAATPGERAAALTALAAAMARARRGVRRRSRRAQAGKPIKLTREFDVPGSIDNVVVLRRRRAQPRGPASAEYDGDHTSIVRREPIGVVGSIAPWNYPLQMAVWKVLPGDRRGQHDRAQAGRAHAAHLAHARRGLPRRRAARRRGQRASPARGRVAGEALLAPPRRAHGLVHRVHARRQAGHGDRVRDTVKRVHLELGGKAPFVVFDDADLEAAIQGAVAGSLINTGQDCTAATRAYVQRPLYDAFVAGRRRRRCARCGSATRPTPRTDQGPLVSLAAARPGRRLRRARARRTAPRSSPAARSPAGPSPRAPTTSPRSSSTPRRTPRSCSDEIFGPVLVVLPVRHRRRGHRAWPTTRRSASPPRRGPATSCRAMRASREIQAGCVWVNDHIPIISEMPHGGYKPSGLRQGHEPVLLRRVHPGQARLVRHHRRGRARTGTARSSATARPGTHRPSTRTAAHHRSTTPGGHRTDGRPAARPHTSGRSCRRCPVAASCAPPASAAPPGRRRVRREGHAAAPARAPPAPRRRRSPTSPTPRRSSNWSNWVSYIDVDDDGSVPSLEAFEKETGITVTYTEDVNGNQDFYAKVRAQLEQGRDIGRDIVVLTDWMAARWIEQGYALPFNDAEPSRTRSNVLPASPTRLRPRPRAHAALAERLRRPRLEQGPAQGGARARTRMKSLERPLGPRAQGQGSRCSTRCATPSA